MDATTEVRTFCRLCEPSCGLVAEVRGPTLISLKPDRAHPVTEGYACHKGLAMADLHVDPDRLDHPMARGADGQWATVGWDDAMAGIAAKLRALTEQYGPDAVAMYTGNPLAFNALGQPAAGALARGLGLRRVFSSGTQDCANKFTASEAIYGSSTIHPIPDIARTDFCLVIGSNPRVSQGSFISIANVMREMKQAVGRGAQFVFVNPRRVETPEMGVGDTVQIKPDTDVYFLASLLHELQRSDGFDEATLRRHGSNVEGLRAFIAAYDPETTAPVTGIPAAVVRDLAQRWQRAAAPCVYASTGINMGRQGTIAYWLVQMLAFATGRLDREGGNLKSDGFYPNAKAGAQAAERMYGETEWGLLRRGALPGTLMADAILDAAQPVRALVVVAGNPLLSIAGGDRLRKALEQLELLVCVDLYRNATGELAHYVLPSTDMLERDDLNVCGIGLSHRPFAQYTPAVLDAVGERRTEHWICHRLLQELGQPSDLDDPSADPWGKWRYMLEKGSGIDLADLVADPRPVPLPAPEPGPFYDEQIQTEDHKVDCCPSTFADALLAAGDIFAELRDEPDGLKLIHRRDAWMMNSWLRNLPRMQKGGRTTNPLWMHPDDAAARNLRNGDPVRVSNVNGEIEAVVDFDDALMRGVVAMSHGWGQRDNPGMSVAQGAPGVNCNALLPSGLGSFERLSSQAHMTGIPVVVEPARPSVFGDAPSLS